MYVSLLFFVTVFVFLNRWNFFSYHIVTPLFIPDLFFEGLLYARHVLNSAEPVVSET